MLNMLPGMENLKFHQCDFNTHVFRWPYALAGHF